MPLLNRMLFTYLWIVGNTLFRTLGYFIQGPADGIVNMTYQAHPSDDIFEPKKPIPAQPAKAAKPPVKSAKKTPAQVVALFSTPKLTEPKAEGPPAVNDGQPLLGKRTAGVAEGRHVIDEERANYILKHYNYVRQRPVSESHVALYRHILESKQWTPGSQLAFGRLDGKLVLINGQHRLRAVAETGIPAEFQVLILPCETEADLHILFHRFDVNTKLRSTTEILNSAGVAEQYDLSKSLARTVYLAGAHIANGFRSGANRLGPTANPETRGVDGKLKVAEPWWPIAVKYEAAIEDADHRLKRQLRVLGIVAVALVIMEAEPAKATEFWSGVVGDANKGDARRTLRDLLLSHNLRNHASGLAYASALTATAWNAYREGRPLKVIKVLPDSEVPIGGTKYTIATGNAT